MWMPTVVERWAETVHIYMLHIKCGSATLREAYTPKIYRAYCGSRFRKRLAGLYYDETGWMRQHVMAHSTDDT